MDEILIPTSALPWTPVECPGSPVPGRSDARRARGVGTYVEADPNFGTAARTVVARRGRRGDRDIPARGAARRLAVCRSWRAGGADRRPTAHATEAARYPPASGDCGDGVWPAPPGVCPVDRPRNHRGDPAPGDCGRRGTRDHSPGLSAPRAEAVAEKKCGASPRWTPSTSGTWRMC